MGEEKLRASYEVSPLGIARNAMDGTFIEANAAFPKIIGDSLAELKRLICRDLTPGRHGEMEAISLHPHRQQSVHTGPVVSHAAAH